MTRKFYYVSEVAILLGVTVQAVNRKIRGRQLNASRFGPRGRYRIDNAELRAFAQENKIQLDWDALRQRTEEKNSSVASRQGSPLPFIPDATVGGSDSASAQPL